ncbi:MAG: hypothetical protein RL011_1702 [Pseudomonadota bacterium]
MSHHRPKIVAVDGPAGSGKSSICDAVSRRLGWTYINTGALYRAVGLLALSRGLDLNDSAGIAAMVDEIAPGLTWRGEDRTLWFEGRNLSLEMNSEQAGYAASKVAKQAAVRDCLLPVQRQLTLSAPQGALVDGRDIGTVVFPDADLKIFVTASLEERSRRRLQQLGSDADEQSIDDIRAGIAKRDERDQGRDTAPLKQADDAVVLDTSDLSMDDSIFALIRLLKGRGLVD